MRRYGEIELKKILHIVDTQDEKILCTEVGIVGGWYSIGEYPNIVAYCKSCVQALIARTA